MVEEIAISGSFNPFYERIRAFAKWFNELKHRNRSEEIKVARLKMVDFPPLWRSNSLLIIHTQYVVVAENRRKRKLAVRMARKCMHICDFNNPQVDLIEKAYKSGVLQDLLRSFRSDPELVTKCLYPAMIEMISRNIFRPVPRPRFPDYDPDDEPNYENSWPHLDLVYKIFSEFLYSSSFTPGFCYFLIDKKFMSKAVQLIESDDPREREMVKSILCQIYQKFFWLRRHMRAEMTNFLLRFMHEAPERYQGLADLIGVIYYFVEGLEYYQEKEEYQRLLEKVLIPLHKVKYMDILHNILADCMLRYVEKDISNAERIILGLLRYWPKSCVNKEILFLSEVERILQILPCFEFIKIQKPLFKQIASSATSVSSLVAERARILFNDNVVKGLIQKNRRVIKPIILPALSTAHWHYGVTILGRQAVKYLEEIQVQRVIQQEGLSKMEMESRRQIQDGRYWQESLYWVTE